MSMRSTGLVNRGTAGLFTGLIAKMSRDFLTVLENAISVRADDHQSVQLPPSWRKRSCWDDERPSLLRSVNPFRNIYWGNSFAKFQRR